MKRLIFILVLLLLAGTVLLRYTHTVQEKPETPVPETESHAVEPEPAEPEHEIPTKEPTQPPELNQEADRSQSALQTGAEPDTQESPPSATQSPGPVAALQPDRGRRESVYNEETYQMVTDIVYLIRNQGGEAEERIRGLVSDLKAADPELGARWEGITDYWFTVSRDFTIHSGVLPDGLAQDDSLAIVVLGFQLLYDGEMAPELIGRCETALASARKYPNAWIIVTGGGTAAGNHEATEAGVMAEWFISHGIARDRIIVEEQSLTTDQNATYTCAILTEQYPGIRELAIVSSDYHVALGSMLFTEAALLHAYENRCDVPYQVVSNAGYATAGNPIYSNPMHFSSDIWIMADPRY